MKDTFRKIANKISTAAGSAMAFILAISLVVIWAFSRKFFPSDQEGFNTWQLVINTTTTIVTFLMVFLIQNTQNRDGKAMQLKLDELIRATKARDAFVGLEDLSDDELAALDGDFQKLHQAQASSAVMKKLHAQILAEHTRRKQKSLAHQTAYVATYAVESILGNPHHNNSDNKPT